MNHFQFYFNLSLSLVTAMRWLFCLDGAFNFSSFEFMQGSISQNLSQKFYILEPHRIWFAKSNFLKMKFSFGDIWLIEWKLDTFNSKHSDRLLAISW